MPRWSTAPADCPFAFAYIQNHSNLYGAACLCCQSKICFVGQSNEILQYWGGMYYKQSASIIIIYIYILIYIYICIHIAYSQLNCQFSSSKELQIDLDAVWRSHLAQAMQTQSHFFVKPHSWSWTGSHLFKTFQNILEPSSSTYVRLIYQNYSSSCRKLPEAVWLLISPGANLQKSHRNTTQMRSWQPLGIW